MISYMNSIEYSHEIYYINILIAYHQLTAIVQPFSKDSHGYSMNPMALASHLSEERRAVPSGPFLDLGGPWWPKLGKPMNSWFQEMAGPSFWVNYNDLTATSL